MKKREITIIPPLTLICENGEFRKYRVGGYMKVIYGGRFFFMDRRPLYDYFEDVVRQYPNWELVKPLPPTLRLEAREASPCQRKNCQLTMHLPYKQGVTGSNPVSPTIDTKLSFSEQLL
ncbi:MAG: hypothetical protein XD78_1368 [Desulfotomaculum sp. 46_296]|nr:MAG: hypothetical protein XD78_1368 [Desulfotomaculum sp. 46_296]HAU32766.1 hypothetical protein [Desulfotomaculum sp.]